MSDAASAYEILKDFAVPVLTFGLGVWFQWWRAKRQTSTQERDRREDLARHDAKAREERIARVLDRYVSQANASLDANESGALAAGVLELRDWTEYRDFCDRAIDRVSAGYEPISRARRLGIRDEQLASYFRLFADAKARNPLNINVAELIAALPAVPSADSTPPQSTPQRKG